MTKIDFYILADHTLEQRQLFACRLAEKAFKLGHSIYLHCDDKIQASTLDPLLWNWRNSSFIPHQVTPAAADNDGSGEYSVEIGHGNNATPRHHDLLINLSSTVPEFFSRFERVSEIIVQLAAVTEAGRANYRFYRDRGYPLENHDLRKVTIQHLANP